MKTITAITALILVLALGLATGCARDQGDSRSASNSQSERTDQSDRMDQNDRTTQSRFDTVVIPDGTSVTATLDSELSTADSRSGDTFAITTVEPIMVGSTTAVPAGARITGVLRDVQASGRTSGRARMTLAYTAITDAEGKSHSISALTLPLEAASNTRTDVERIAAGTVLGAVVGGIAGGGKGAAIGAGAGAGAGAVVMLATQGDEIVLEAGQQMIVHITSPTSLEVMARN